MDIVEGRQNRGSITVEASIIVPLVILSICAVIYMGLFLYQRALVQSAAEAAAGAGAASWDAGADMLVISRPEDPDSEGFKLYRCIIDSERDVKLEKIKAYALSASSRNEIIPAVETATDVEVVDYAVYRKLEVTISKKYKIPFGRLVKLFGGKETAEISVKAVSTINDPAEFIRTADLVIDIEKKLENEFPELEEIGSKTRETMNGIKDKLKNFLE